MSDTQQNPNFTYRPDIDGLRAVAILLVVIFHAYPKFLRGGFIGVDIFFVISGYLITSIILKQQSQNNFSLLDFYSRRVKRIFPSLIVVLTFALVAGWYILLENEYELLGKHIAAGSIYISNFVLQSESGYFDIDSELKPLLHLWSLAIEEQFYLMFPLLLIVGGRCRVNPLIIISTCLGVSFLLNVVQIDDKPTEVFFFPTSRAWELLIGSLIAYLSIHSIGKKQVEQHANWLAWFGVLLIFMAWIFLNSTVITFPSWWALMPTIGAASLIFAGEGAWFNRKILASRIAIFIGLISYPLYLWHWVLLSFARITEIEKPSALLKFSILVMSFFLAFLTYQFVEKNVRFQKSKLGCVGLLISLWLIGVAGYSIQQKNCYTNCGNEKSEKEKYSIDNSQKIWSTNGYTSKSCTAKYSTLNADFCLLQEQEKSPTALLVGDSHANHFYSALVTNKNLTGGNLLNLGSGGCFPFFDNPMKPNEKCQPLINQVLELAISTSSVETVILAGRAVTEINEKSFINTKSWFLLKQNQKNIDPYLLFQTSMKKTLRRLINARKNVIFVLDTPDLEFLPASCLNRPWRMTGQKIKNPCAISRIKVDERRQKYINLVTKVLDEFPTVKVWDTLPAFCDSEYCWATKDGKILYRDENHLNEAGAVYLGKYLQGKEL
jgi:peptidoglycan/LPS O-acetylase OafA/YrhL